jgi:hypothetical protein
MKKTVIFVEGQTELIFVREYLLKWFDWQVDVECTKLTRDGDFEYAEYNAPFPTAEQHFQIIDVGTDVSVLSKIIKYEKRMRELGYEKFIGLRDMYSELYKSKSKTYDKSLTDEFITDANDEIRYRTTQPDSIHICFAIMETEAWFLGHYALFERMDSRLTTAFIHQNLKIDLTDIDPETHIFHPAPLVGKILDLVGLTYKKRQDEVNKIVGKFKQEDYQMLLDSDKCQSFNHFHAAIHD